MNAIAQSIGHNAPPPDLKQGEDLRTLLEATNGDILDRASQLTDAEARLPDIADDEAAGKVSDYIKQLTACSKAAEAKRVGAKEPYLDGTRVVDGFFKGITDPLGAIKRRVEAKLTVFLRDKADKERRAREEAARLAQEEAVHRAREAQEAAAKMATSVDLGEAIVAETRANQAAADAIEADKAAHAKAATLSQTRGDYGALAGLRENWKFEITDIGVIPRNFLMVNEAAVKAHTKARLKDQPPAAVPGIRFYQDTSAVVR